MVITTTALKSFEKVFIDVVRPFPQLYNGNSYNLTLLDDVSKFAWALPIKNHEANTVTKHFVTQLVCLHGQPESSDTDCEIVFVNKIFKKVYKLLKISQTSTTSHHLQSNDSLEHSHRTLSEYLQNYSSKSPKN